MKTNRILFVAWLAALILPGAALGGISGTDHDFSGRSWNTRGTLCGICHASHHVATAKPAWNHTLSSTNFTWGATSTYAGTTLPTNIRTWQGSSKLCLSCHDGTVAVGDLIYNGFSSSEYLSGDEVVVSGGVIASHPVAIPYPYGGQANTYNGISSGSGLVMSAYIASPTGVRLYSDTGSGAVSVGPATGKSGIECGSCHDPHDGSNGSFLRRSSGTLCTACHNM